jgi:hypothetical protein
MQGIFISYRRQDSQSAAGRLADSLKEQLPQAAVFRDVETIEAGVDFVNAINAALESCGVLLAVIGPRWVSIQDDAGRRRLDDPNDYTRLELAAALARADVRVIPVLVDGASMPDPAALPADLKSLARRHAVELTDKRWDYDVAQLAATLRRVLGMDARTALPRSWRGPGAALAGLLVAFAGYLIWQAQKPDALPPAVSTPADPDEFGLPGVTPAAPAPELPVGAARPVIAGDPTEPCPMRLSINRDLPTPFTCICSPENMLDGSVWGTDQYTDDSSLCRAARHAGVITADGGAVTVERGVGRALYIGSSRNGIRSSDYGAYSHSIRFAGAARPGPGPEPCPTRLSINRELPTPFSCICSPETMQDGAVWGTDAYTDDSSLCRAARHAGVIAADGGPVTVVREAGRALYVGSSRNGIRSSDYGAYSHSIRFQARRSR